MGPKIRCDSDRGGIIGLSVRIIYLKMTNGFGAGIGWLR